MRRRKKMHKWLKRGLCALLVLAMGIARADDDCDDCYAQWWETERKNGITWAYYEQDGEAVIVDAVDVGKSLVIPSELGGLPVCVIDDWAFDGEDMESVTIPECVHYVSGTSFGGCSKLKTFMVDPDNEYLKVENGMLMSSGGRTVFRASSALTSVTIPDDVTTIDSCAFDGLTKLTTVNIGAAVEEIGNYAFSGCSALKTITVDSENEYFMAENGLLMTTDIDESGRRRLVRASSSLTSVVIPEGIDVISVEAFSGLKGLKSVTIPEGVEYVGEFAFEGCVGLTTVTVPDSVIEIGESAFEDCAKLNTVIIGAGVELIGEFAFTGCKALKKVVFNGNRPYYDYWDEVWDEEDEDEDEEKYYEYLFEDAPSSCVIFVQEDSDWGKYYYIPGTWFGHKIRYSLYIGCEGLEYGSFMAGVKGDDDEGLYLDLPEDVKTVTVKGLPAGMKLAKFKDDEGVYWTIVGAPTKSGTFTATISVTTQDGTKDDKAITFTVDAISPMAVGTFKGFVVEDINCILKSGTMQLTTTAAGKISAKVVTASGTYSFSASAWDWVNNNDGIYGVSMETKKGEYLAIELKSASDLNQEAVSGFFLADEESDGFTVCASRNLLGKTWYFAADVVGDEGGWALEEVYDAKAANLTLSMKGDGTTALKGKLDATSVNAAGFADFSMVEDGRIVAEFAPVVSVREGKKSVKKTLSISLDLPFSHEAAASGSADLVE